ncbi:cell division protease FtsH [Kineosphaera limosa]|uniref:ATP-dependent zinc metalloprotease FtsH n=1 Tax=Kineosphaera limosa NBRC 100340 TaxID=1184609 RepID=K6WQ86_9MICO|nr:ATP-dependent zinc metalloprotease FtsH [Kineosphaera limosa]NYE02837.1 cell division protease FtsH [Kineosphaera limosa]GAB94267.1 cell division protein FtsH [Kineosphaera limosa NBRC 100340]
MAEQRKRGEGDTPADQHWRPWRTEGVPEDPERADGSDGKRRSPKIKWRNVLLTMLLVYLGSFLVASWFDVRNDVVTIPYTEFNQQVAARNVTEVYAKGDTIQGELREQATSATNENRAYTLFQTERPTFAQDNLLATLEQQGTIVRATPVVEQRGLLGNMLSAFLPILLLIAFYVWMFRRQQSMMGGAGGGLFGGGRKSKLVDPETVRVTFADVAGIDEVEDQIDEIVDYLRDPDRYAALGARAPRGVLLAGPPGTGKTLLARATAGEAGVPFFSASASEFIEMIVGVGAQRVRELFGEARKVAPAIIFIDEIDTIGRARGGPGALGGHDEREQTLNQILTEMDGFSGSEGVIVLAATNRAEVLDPALLRPGRFDRTIMVHSPDAAGRLAILMVHTREVPLAEDVDLGAVALSTPGMTGAELANLVNEAALLAARRGEKFVTQSLFSQALEKVQLGAARNVVMPEDERRRTAYHEAGHALLGMLQPGADPVRKISIIPRGRALGVTLSTPDVDRYGYDREYLRGRIVGALGGMAAEDVVFDVVTTGAESDLQTSTAIARQMVGRWGMSEKVGPVQIYPAEGDPRAAGFSDEMLSIADAEVRRIVEECYAEATTKLRAHHGQLDAIVEALLKKETLDEPEVYAAAGIERPPAPVGLLQVSQQESAPAGAAGDGPAG